MTKADKSNAVAALALLVMLALMGHHMRGNSLRFTVGFPTTLWLIWFWLNRAWAKPFLVKQTVSEVIFERPLILRALFGFFGAFLVLLLIGAVQRAMRDEALHDTYSGISYSLGETNLPILLLTVFVGLPALGFLWLAGSHRVLFDLECCQFCFTGGLLFLPQTVQGGTTEGVLRVRSSRRNALMFRPSGHRYSYILGFYTTDDEARTEAHNLADKLNMTVERRDVIQRRTGRISWHITWG